MRRIVQSDGTVFSELNGVVAVATHRNFRRAAAELGVSASALSHAIASLERRLGVTLFQRTTRSVSLSEAGARFLERVRPALDEIAHAIETVNDFRDKPTGTLRINTALAAARRIFDPLIIDFIERYPDMRVEITTDGRLVDIVADGFDAGIRLAESVPRDMIAIPCSTSMRFVVVGSPAYFERHGRPRSPADLHAHACIRRHMPSGAVMPWEFERGAESIVIDVAGPLALDADELMISAALRGIGLAWINAWSVESLLADGRLVSTLDDWSPAFAGLCLYYPQHRHMSAGLRTFVDLIRASKIGRGHVRTREATATKPSKKKRLPARRRK